MSKWAIKMATQSIAELRALREQQQAQERARIEAECDALLASVTLPSVTEVRSLLAEAVRIDPWTTVYSVPLFRVALPSALTGSSHVQTTAVNRLRSAVLQRYSTPDFPEPVYTTSYALQGPQVLVVDGSDRLSTRFGWFCEFRLQFDALKSVPEPLPGVLLQEPQAEEQNEEEEDSAEPQPEPEPVSILPAGDEVMIPE